MNGNATRSTKRARLPWARIAAAAALLTAATPPAWFPGAEFLVVLGLAAWFAIATSSRRPWASCYWIGALHVGAFSWSLRHVAWFGWFAVAVLGGLYYAAAGVATHRAQKSRRALWAPLVFAIAVAGSCWLRAEMPGIAYPHGQFAHALWEWPSLLSAVRIGGEPLQNVLLAGLAAALAQCASSWRIAQPTQRVARMQLAIAGCLCVLVAWIGRAPSRTEPSSTVAIAAIETGLHPFDAFADVRDRRSYESRWSEILEQRLLAPTRRIAGRDAPNPPDLVLWPESSVPFSVRAFGNGKPQLAELRGAFSLAPNTQVLLGADAERDGGRHTPAAVLLDAEGRYLGHHEKQRLVPAGETLPVGWLPESWANAIREFAQTGVGIPDLEPGRALPPLRLAPDRDGDPGAPFAGLICYDNAFHQPVADAVVAGAQFVCVLSNEAWYRGGGELEQLCAITVLRAIACDCPIVRCTTDGTSMAVDRDGRAIAALPRATAPQAEARVLRVDVPLAGGQLPTAATWHPVIGWACSIGLVVAMAFAGLAPVLRRQGSKTTVDPHGSGS
jgi:apolipoprotein N-acyltransferase